MHVTVCLGVGDVRAYVYPKIQPAHIETLTSILMTNESLSGQILGMENFARECQMPKKIY